MKKNSDAPQITGAELRNLFERVQRGEVVKADGDYIRSGGDLRRQFAAHPELAIIEGRDEESGEDTEEHRDFERQATLARIAELEGYLDANQKSFEAQNATIEALQDEKERAETVATEAVKRAEKAEAAEADAKKIAADAVAQSLKAEKENADLVKQVAALQKEIAKLKAAKPDETKPENTGQ